MKRSHREDSAKSGGAINVLYMFTFMFNFEIKTNKKQKAVKPPLQILGNVKLQVLMFKCEKQPLKDQLYQLPYIS